MTKTPQERKIVVSKDGPYLVSGDVPIALQIITPDSDGMSWEWKEGNTLGEKSSYALCRCGHSKRNHSVTVLIPKSGSMATRPRVACLTRGRRKPLKGPLWS